MTKLIVPPARRINRVGRVEAPIIPSAGSTGLGHAMSAGLASNGYLA
jgi:hypothetical protein